jgi:two-component system chemotaxis response regulator CheY
MADIIIIDDSRYMRDILRAMLEKHGHKVEEAADGKLGLELVAKVHPDCITIDLSMPVLDGLGVLKELQERGIELGKIVVSADVQKTTRESCIGFGADAFLNKPPQEEELIETIARLVGERAEAVS